jgi:hypothetical protein
MRNIMKKLLLLSAAVCLVALDASHKVLADVVTDWDTILINAVKTDTANPSTTQPGPGWSSRNMAMVTAAMCDAVDNASTSLNVTPYAYTGLMPAADSTVAAATAAYDVLVNLYPNQKALFDVDLGQSLVGHTGQGRTDGIALGNAVAAAVLAKRANDGSQTSVNYTVNTALGHWQPDPLHPTQSAWGPNWGAVTPFVLTPAQNTANAALIQSKVDAMVPGSTNLSMTSTQFLSSPAFAAAYNQVISVGASNSTTRTADQTNAVYFWAYDQGGIGPPSVNYNQILQTIAKQQGNTLQQNARLFALANMAMADAGIVSWASKYQQDFFRPITAALESSQLAAINPGISPIAGWTPLGAPNGIPGLSNTSPFTPPFPSFTSGHASFGGALFETLKDFYGTDNITFTLTSDNLPGVDRTYTSFTQAELENAESRVWMGVHYQFDADIGVASGESVGNDVFAETLVPVPEPSALVLAGVGAIGFFMYWRNVRARSEN